MSQCEICGEGEAIKSKDGVSICSVCDSKWVVKRRKARRVDWCNVGILFMLTSWYTFNHLMLYLCARHDIVLRVPSSVSWCEVVMAGFIGSLLLMVIEGVGIAVAFSIFSGLRDWLYPQIEVEGA